VSWKKLLVASLISVCTCQPLHDKTRKLTIDDRTIV